MREIKFRAWDKENKTMTYGGSFQTLESANGKLYEWFGMRTPHPDDCELMQYTNLKDKNGVEIYEGDIISLIRCPKRHFSCMCEKKPDPSFTGQVIFKNGCFICAEVENSISEYVVIGNIYENPPTTGEKGEV